MDCGCKAQSAQSPLVTLMMYVLMQMDMHLANEVCHVDGASASGSLGGDSYIERVLRSAAACWPIGLEIPSSNGREGGYLMVSISGTDCT